MGNIGHKLNEIISNLDQWFRRCRLKYFLSRALVAIFFRRAEHLSILVESLKEEHLCEVILDLGQWLRRRCRLKKMFMDNRRQSMHDALVTLDEERPQKLSLSLWLRRAKIKRQ